MCWRLEERGGGWRRAVVARTKEIPNKNKREPHGEEGREWGEREREREREREDGVRRCRSKRRVMKWKREKKRIASTFAVSFYSAPSPLRRRRSSFPVVRAQSKFHSKFLTSYIFFSFFLV